METLAPISTELDWLLRIIVAAICGGVIGYERAIQRKSAGVRTHIVVAIASALFMIVSKYGFTDLLNMHDIALDPSRIAAQIVTGISFIGAGMYFIGVLSTALLFIIQMVFHDDIIISKITPHIRFNIQIEAANTPHILSRITKELENSQVENISIKILDVNEERIVFYVDGVINNKLDENKIIMSLRKYPDIDRISYTRGGR
ncbi:MgtC/SapB family protein [Lactobacillus ultunensis]|uniref:Mg2+ transporter-C family protein n=1 Tax=Lactobacillus ultunensis DSM 16047 TaxID=525365 RepID=C2ENU6_9LACO|nr:MgtC/SapB family protein [Lactobacillus ultunensis]EEJ71729.1 Mg2+ transporter-C family protein [Lactobacillus ultunensis DSM 16047]KRL82169.1 Mg2+ transporter [Lactobacillus ultunensis DSM 16047]